MSDHPIVAFIEARYAEIQALAEEATPAPWEPDGPFRSDMVASALLGPVADCSIRTGYRPQSLEDARHIAQQDPAFVLTDLASKRAILLEHHDVNDGDCGTCIVAEWGYPTHGGSTIARHPCKTVRLLAAPFASHPDYLAEWAV